MNRIHPLGSRVLVRHKAPERVSKGGVVLPEFKPGATPTEYGTVIEAGPEAPSTITPGTEVVFHRHAGAELDLEGEKYQLLLAESVMATVDVTPDIEIEDTTPLSAALEEQLYGEDDDQ